MGRPSLAIGGLVALAMMVVLPEGGAGHTPRQRFTRIARSADSSLWWQLTALLRAPGLRDTEAAIRGMLASVELLPVDEPV
jgi:hypothetical protein